MPNAQPNVRDLAKRFEALTPPSANSKPKPTLKSVTQRSRKNVVHNVARPRCAPPMPLRRVQSSRRRRLYQSALELGATAKQPVAKWGWASFHALPSAVRTEGWARLTDRGPEAEATTIAAGMAALGPRPLPPPKPRLAASQVPHTLAVPGQMSVPKQRSAPSPQLVRPKSKPPSPHSPQPLLDSGNRDASQQSANQTSHFSRNDRKRAIRKPSNKPPPPPPKPLCIPAAQPIYQSLSSPGSDSESPSTSSFAVFPLPRLPQLPPPNPPTLFLNSNEQTSEPSEDLYEEIEQEFQRSLSGGLSTASTCSTSRISRKRRETQPIYSLDEGKPLASYDYIALSEQTKAHTLDRSGARRFVEQMKGHRDREAKAARNMCSSMLASLHVPAGRPFDTWNLGRRKRRPELNNLMRMKSELQLNISKKVGRLKRKVAGNPTATPHNNSSGRLGEESSQVDDQLYGDDWSSEENEEKAERIEKYGGQPTTAEPEHATNFSLLNEIEAEYHDTFGSQPSSRQLPSECPMADPIPPSIPTSSSTDQVANLRGLAETGRISSLPEEFPPRRVDPEENDNQSCSSSSVQDEEEEKQKGEHVPDNFYELSVTLPDNLDSDSISELDRKSIYESKLAVSQPLYQIYMLQEHRKLLEDMPGQLAKVKLQVPGEENEADSVCDSNDACSIHRQSSSASTDSGRGADTESRNASTNNVKRDRLTAGSVYGSQRSLWCELPEVRSAGLLDTLDTSSKKLQEAFFEVITSEASYLRSINVLLNLFMTAPELQGPKKAMSVITNTEKKCLFSNIISVRDCAERLLCDLENRLKESLVLLDVCDILCEHFEKHFEAYVKYCSNQVYQDRTLKRLKNNNSQFLTCVQRIEANRECHGLDMRSFLMLPMQRVTRYPLLVFAILDRVQPNSRQHDTAHRALNLANQLVHNCNEGARRMERTEQLFEIERRLVYKDSDLKRVALVTTGRYIIKSGPVTQLLERKTKPKLGGVLQAKQRSKNMYLFLFSDLLMIAKKKMNGTFVCKDYAARRFVEVEPVEPHSSKIPTGVVANLPNKAHLFLCVLMQNARNRQVELLFNVESESDRERWLSAMRPPTCSNPDEKIYAEWDCPQAVACHRYEASQEDELSLEEGDLINVLRKMSDGWFFGERTKDHKGGWFPSSYVQQVMNDHVRANNYRQRLKLIHAANDLHHAAHLGRSVEKRDSLIPGGLPPLNRLRRLSNPRAFFTSSE